jgi:hypothetical protein
MVLIDFIGIGGNSKRRTSLPVQGFSDKYLSFYVITATSLRTMALGHVHSVSLLERIGFDGASSTLYHEEHPECARRN